MIVLISIVSSLGITLLVSLFSGLIVGKIFPGDLWPFSPLGILGHFPWNLATVPDVCSFQGAYSFHLDYFFIYLRTVLLEAPFYLWLFFPAGLANGTAILFFANLLTHPLVFFAFPCLGQSTLFSLLAGELFAAAVEVLFVLWLRSRLIPQVSRRRCVVVIVLANLFSWQMGIFLFF